MHGWDGVWDGGVCTFSRIGLGFAHMMDGNGRLVTLEEGCTIFLFFFTEDTFSCSLLDGDYCTQNTLASCTPAGAMNSNYCLVANNNFACDESRKEIIIKS